MAESTTLMALFPDIDPAAEAVESLRSLGVADDQIEIISGIPLLEPALGRPKRRTMVPRLALGGASLGLLLGLFLAYGIPILFPLHVGGQPLFPGPPGIILVFEMSMLGLMGSAFIGVFLESYLPAWRPLKYIPEVSNGKIALLFNCSETDQEKFIQAMQAVGAESVAPAVARQL